MNSPFMISGMVVGYFLAFSLVLIACMRWQARRQNTLLPQEFKLQRAPGETLRRRVQKADEDGPMQLVMAAFAPLVLASFILLGAVRFVPSYILWALPIAAATLLGGLYVGGTSVIRTLERRRNDLLGYLGERAVGEQLQPLFAKGYQVFHDVPAESGEKAFNLDHVTVGPSGVAIVETKTRRKKKGRPDFPGHTVESDGQRLIWPWGEDQSSLNQAAREADWLGNWIHKRTGLNVDVQPVIAVPGWFVTETRMARVRVTNHKTLCRVIEGRRSPTQLSDREIDLISRQLDLTCRDVAD